MTNATLTSILYGSGVIDDECADDSDTGAIIFLNDAGDYATECNECGRGFVGFARDVVTDSIRAHIKRTGHYAS